MKYVQPRGKNEIEGAYVNPNSRVKMRGLQLREIQTEMSIEGE